MTAVAKQADEHWDRHTDLREGDLAQSPDL